MTDAEITARLVGQNAVARGNRSAVAAAFKDRFLGRTEPPRIRELWEDPCPGPRRFQCFRPLSPVDRARQRSAARGLDLRLRGPGGESIDLPPASGIVRFFDVRVREGAGEVVRVTLRARRPRPFLPPRDST